MGEPVAAKRGGWEQTAATAVNVLTPDPFLPPWIVQSAAFYQETWTYAENQEVLLYPSVCPKLKPGEGEDVFRTWPIIVKAEGDSIIKEFIVQNKPRFV